MISSFRWARFSLSSASDLSLRLLYSVPNFPSLKALCNVVPPVMKMRQDLQTEHLETYLYQCNLPMRLDAFPVKAERRTLGRFG